MKPVFGDTAFFLALLNPADELHQSAKALNQRPAGPLLTTEFILTEVGDALSQPQNRPRFARLLALLRQQADVQIVPASAALFHQGCQLHAERADKEWSVTDCISFVVMRERRIDEALTADHHFQQAGFRILLGK